MVSGSRAETKLSYRGFTRFDVMSSKATEPTNGPTGEIMSDQIGSSGADRDRRPESAILCRTADTLRVCRVRRSASAPRLLTA